MSEKVDCTEDSELPECPYNCPYSPTKEERPDYDTEAEVSEITEEVYEEEAIMGAILRSTDHETEIHFQNVWQTDFGLKVGVTSTKQHKDIFNDLEWEKSHHRWKTERVENTEMWEVDLDAVFYVAAVFFDHDVDVTIEDSVLEAYIEHSEGNKVDTDNS